jgi:hypothetical protein
MLNVILAARILAQTIERERAMNLTDEEFVRLWYSEETEASISTRLGIGHDELISAWRRLKLIPSMKTSKAENHYDGRPSVDDDPLLMKLKSGLR